MKKIIFWIIPLILFSCSNVNNQKINYIENETLKSKITEKESIISWANEIEGDRLSKKINSHKKVKKNSNFTVEMFKSVNLSQNEIFPYLEDFGSLDDSKINVKQKENLTNFFELLKTDSFASFNSFFIPKYSFNYSFFFDDLNKNWKNRFNEDFPHKKIEKKEETKKNETNENEINDSENKVEKSSIIEEKNPPLFDSILYGEPFIGEDFLTFPVRLFCKKGKIDLSLLINKEGKLYQIVIKRWFNE